MVPVVHTECQGVQSDIMFVACGLTCKVDVSCEGVCHN